MEGESKITSISIPNHETLNHLEEYNHFLKTIFVRKLKSLSTIGGYTNVVCVNALKQINLSDEICKLINSIIIKFPGFNVYSGILISHLLLKLWTEPTSDNDLHELSNALETFQSLLKTSIEAMKTERKTINVNFLQMLVLPVLMEEPEFCLGKDWFHNLSLNIVKAALSATDNDLRLGSVRVFVANGENSCTVVKGILCEVDDSFLKLIESTSFRNSDSCNILLCTESKEFCDKLAIIIEEIVKSDIVLFVCQKKLPDMAKIMLRRARILTIECVGEDVMKALEQLTGAVPLRDIEKYSGQSLTKLIGNFSDINIISKGKRNLVSILNFEHSVVTLYIQCRTFADSSLIKEVVNNSVHLVWSALSSPFYLPGPISFEDSLKSSLKANLTTATSLDTIIVIFINALEEISSLYNKSALQNIDYLDTYSLKRNVILHSLEAVMNILCVCRIVRRT